jgi:hypothetical protein
VTGNVATGEVVIGVVAGFKADTRDSLLYRANSTARYVYVHDDPDLEYVVQVDGVGPVADDIGATADLTGFTSGSATTGYSSIQVAKSTVTASGDGSQDVSIVGLYRAPDNIFGQYGKVVVRLNNHYHVDGVAGGGDKGAGQGTDGREGRDAEELDGQRLG